jgi:hypothetical protein
MIIPFINETVNLPFDILEIKPLLALAVHLGKQNVVMAVLATALGMPGDYVSRGELPLVQASYVGSR